MACRDTLPSDTSFLLEYLEQLPYESDSDGDKFEVYLGPEDDPVIIRAFDYAGYEDQELQSPPYRSRSLESLTVMGQECESPLPALAPPSPLCTLAPRMQLLTASHTQLLTPYSGRAKSTTMAKARTIGLVL